MYIDSWQCPSCNFGNNYKYEPDIIQNDAFVDTVICEYCDKQYAIDVSVGITITSILTKEQYERIFKKEAINE